MRAFLCFAAAAAAVACVALALPVNLRADEEEENEVDNSGGGDDSDLYNGLVHLGAAIFGTPNKKSGEAVSAWKETSPLNPEEMGEYAEGDILHPINGAASRNGLKATSSRWPKGVIPYEINPYFCEWYNIICVIYYNIVIDLGPRFKRSIKTIKNALKKTKDGIKLPKKCPES